MTTPENPFTPPSADPSGGTRRPSSPIVAVIVGVLADIVGTILATSLLYGIIAAALITDGASSDELEGMLTNPAPFAWYSIVGYAVGTLFSFLGGYICARMARRKELELAAIVAVVVTVFGLMVSTGQLPLALDVFLVAVTFVATLFGASRGASRNRALGYSSA